jgi:hypothetical protein
MRKFKVIKEKRKVTHQITCNKCGKKINLSEAGYEYNIYPFRVSFGYGSKHDLEHWYFDLCEDCIDKMVSEFLIQPDTYIGDVWDGDTFSPYKKG